MNFCSKVAKSFSIHIKQIRNSVNISRDILNTYLSEHLLIVTSVFLLMMSEKKQFKTV